MLSLVMLIAIVPGILAESPSTVQKGQNLGIGEFNMLGIFFHSATHIQSFKHCFSFSMQFSSFKSRNLGHILQFDELPVSSLLDKPEIFNPVSRPFVASLQKISV